MWFILCSSALLFCSILWCLILASLLAFRYLTTDYFSCYTEGYAVSLPCGSDGKKSACNAGDLGLSPGLGRSPGEGMATHSRFLAWEIPWTEEPGSCSLWGCKDSDGTEQLMLSLCFSLICEPRMVYFHSTSFSPFELSLSCISPLYASYTILP